MGCSISLLLDVGKRLKGYPDDIPKAILLEMSAVQKQSLSLGSCATKGRFKTDK